MCTTQSIVPIVAGQGGTLGSTDWDDGSHVGVKQIFLVIRGDAILFFKAIYADGFQTTKLSPQAAQAQAAQALTGLGQTRTVTIELAPGEQITDVSGYVEYDDYTNKTIVRLLKFQTNYGRSFGPYGVKKGVRFHLPIDSECYRIAGFKGSSCVGCVNAIGINVSPNNIYK